MLEQLKLLLGSQKLWIEPLQLILNSRKLMLESECLKKKLERLNTRLKSPQLVLNALPRMLDIV